MLPNLVERIPSDTVDELVPKARPTTVGEGGYYESGALLSDQIEPSKSAQAALDDVVSNENMTLRRTV